MEQIRFNGFLIGYYDNVGITQYGSNIAVISGNEVPVPPQGGIETKENVIPTIFQLSGIKGGVGSYLQLRAVLTTYVDPFTRRIMRLDYKQTTATSLQDAKNIFKLKDFSTGKSQSFHAIPKSFLVQALIEDKEREPNADLYIRFSMFPSGTLIGSHLSDSYAFFSVSPTLTNIGTDFPIGGDSTGDIGGNGSFDGSSDIIGLPDDPLVDFTQYGLVSLYEMGTTEMVGLANYFYTADFSQNFWKMFGDPWQALISCTYLPISDEKITGIVKEIVLGNLLTGVNATKISSQYVRINCGSLTTSPYFGNFLDYSPYTNYELYLPFIGFVPINSDSVVNSTITIEYLIDLMTCSAVCNIHVKNATVDAVLYTFNCSVGAKIPLTGVDYSNVYRTIATIGGAVVGGVITGGASTAMMGALGASATSILQKPTINKSNQMGGNSGQMNVLKPYMTISRPIQNRPHDFNNYDGYTLNVTKKLGDLFGYTQISKITIENINATKKEIEMIEQLLKDGVYL